MRWNMIHVGDIKFSCCEKINIKIVIEYLTNVRMKIVIECLAATKIRMCWSFYHLLSSNFHCLFSLWWVMKYAVSAALSEEEGETITFPRYLLLYHAGFSPLLGATSSSCILCNKLVPCMNHLINQCVWFVVLGTIGSRISECEVITYQRN